MPTLIEELAQEHLRGSLPLDFIELMRPLDEEREEVKAFVRRAFGYMGLADFRPKDFSWSLGFQLTATVPGLLPGAWGGSPPPITQAGRNLRFDDYLASNNWWAPTPEARFLDIGCGFPPLTTIDTATRFPELQVTGLDPAFGDYLVYDEVGDYACFDRDGTMRFCYAGNSQPVRVAALYRDLAATGVRFSVLRDQLMELLPLGDDPASAESAAGRILRQPISTYETDHLHFVKGSIGSTSGVESDFVRCASVFLYFDRAWREDARRWIGRLLSQGGLLLHGGASPVQRAERYFAWRREGETLVPREFAIAPSNLRPVAGIPFFSIQEDDLEELAMNCKVSAAAWSSDAGFREAFDSALDAILADVGYCTRRPDGFLGQPPDGKTPEQTRAALVELDDRLSRDGWVGRVAEVIRQGTGKNAWQNAIGHLAVDPLEWGWEPLAL